MLIFRQKSLQFCTPRLKSRQPILPWNTWSRMLQQQDFPRIYISFPLFQQWPSRFCMAKKLKYVWCNDIFTSVLHKELIARLTQSQIQYFILYYHHLDHQICVRGHPQKMLVRFWLFLIPYPTNLAFSTLK